MASYYALSFALGLAAMARLATFATAQNGTLPLFASRMTGEACQPVLTKCIKQLDNGKECELIPIPRRSFVDDIPAAGYKLTKLRQGVWAFDSGAYLALILQMDERLAVVDFPDGCAEKLLKATEEILDGVTPKRIDLVYSHSHYDHIGGATEYHKMITGKYPRAFIMIWGTFETRRAIDASQSKRAIKPNVIVQERGRTLSLGPGLDVKMHILGGHTQSDLLLYIPKYRDQASVAMLVDIVFPKFSPFLNLALTKDFRKYIEAQKELLNFDFDLFVGGHVNVGGRRDVIRNLRFSEDLMEAGATAIETTTQADFVAAGIGKFGDPSAREFKNVWFAFVSVVRRLQMETCYRIMLEKWGCKLAALDLTLMSHCFISVEFAELEA